MKLTTWFAEHIKPARIGVYETSYHLDGKEWDYGYSYWNGEEWTNGNNTVNGAYAKHLWVEGAIQDKRWRGLAEAPK